MTEGSIFKYSYGNPFSLLLYVMMLKFMKIQGYIRKHINIISTCFIGKLFAVLQFMQVISKQHNGMKHDYMIDFCSQVIWSSSHLVKVIWSSSHLVKVIWSHSQLVKVIWSNSHLVKVIWSSSHLVKVIWSSSQLVKVIWSSSQLVKVIWSSSQLVIVSTFKIRYDSIYQIVSIVSLFVV